MLNRLKPFLFAALAVALLACAAPSAQAQNLFLNPLPTIDKGSYTPLGCYQITGLSTAKALTTIPAGATLIALSVSGQSVRMRDDGTNPTASVGLVLPVGGPWPFNANLSAVKFIETASSATIDYCAYK